MFLLWKIVFAINFVCLIVDCQFENQYLGHYITREQYNSQEIACQTKICLRDSQRLLLQATQNDTVEPCDDFEEFSMGQFKKFAALNERYSYIGLAGDLQTLDWERERKVLAAKIKDTDIRPFKIAKNFYQKCVNSGNIQQLFNPINYSLIFIFRQCSYEWNYRNSSTCEVFWWSSISRFFLG